MPFVIDVNPVAVQLGGFAIRWYGVVVAIALGAGLWYASREAARHGIDAGTFEAAVWWLGIAGVLGARTLYVVQWGLGPTADPLHFLMLWDGGLSFYGGLVGGAVALAVFARRRGLPLALLADVAAAAAALGMAIGHVGCLISGDSYGIPTSLPWAIVYRNPGAMAPLGVPLQPTQVYEAVAVGLLFVGLVAGRARLERMGAGATAGAYLVGLSVIRFALFFLRDEPPVLLGLKTAQWLGIGIGLAGAAALVAVYRRRSSIPVRTLPEVA